MDATMTALTTALGVGLGLGAAYFGTLWLAVSRLSRSSRPMLWLVGGAAVRLAVLLPVLFLVARGGLAALVACLIGFLAARLAWTRWARPRQPSRT